MGIVAIESDTVSQHYIRLTSDMKTLTITNGYLNVISACDVIAIASDSNSIVKVSKLVV